MKTIEIVNEELFNNKVVNVELDFHNGGMNGDVAIELVGVKEERCYTGEHGENDYLEEFGFKIIDKKEIYVICDHTQNSGKPYIDDYGNNTGTIEGALKFDTLEEAESYIVNNGWSKWAYVESI